MTDRPVDIPDSAPATTPVEIVVTRPEAAAETLCRLLAARCGRPVTADAFLRGAKGKPALADPAAPRFNLSHCRDLALVAVAATAELGIDVERADRRLDVGRLARRILSPAEAEAFALLAGEAERRRYVLRAWVRKEAVVKALGHGLTVPLAGINTASDAGRARPLGSDAETGWYLIDLDLPGHVAALAALGARPIPIMRLAFS